MHSASMQPQWCNICEKDTERILLVEMKLDLGLLFFRAILHIITTSGFAPTTNNYTRSSSLFSFFIFCSTMRRSKSDPAKYARNYRKISQRRMTQFDDAVDEDQEIQRLRAVLKNSERHLQQAQEHTTTTTTSDGGGGSSVTAKKRKNAKDLEEDDNKKNVRPSILSEEMQAESLNMTGGENDLVVLPPKKKKKKTKSATILTPEEIREAKLLQKKTTKKLQQLETRVAQKKRRAELYKRLEETNISQATLQPLLSSSGKLSRKDTDTKKQALKKILNKDRAGLALSEEERELLYPTRTVPDDLTVPSDLTEPLLEPKKSKEGEPPKSSTTKKQKTRKRMDGSEVTNTDTRQSQEEAGSADATVPTTDAESGSDNPLSSNKPTAGKSQAINDNQKSNTGPTIDFAAQMMASLSNLKAVQTNVETKAKESLEENLAKTNDQSKTRYVPSNPAILKTAASMGLLATDSPAEGVKRKVLEIKRPADLAKTRFDLPVTAMEFEIMDSIRNNDVTIVCAETGSGKSTQVPQFLFENGFSLNSRKPDASFVIGVTQPRRVAAVSTAKRVCFEMGQGDGQSIKNVSGGKGNLVAYKTRYETAGMGKFTRVQFMTDGILLQEIQSDLLLRRYSVIVLDETHERNLNTDILIGLLSKALPLRKKAAEQDPENIVPLKLVLMSATLRVEDFTKNDALFPTGPPAVVSVPGRNHPVTIHHTKVTELEDYESVAFQKICKIHRKLPRGGILVFLTGKAEIVRMVNRLRRTLNGPTKRDKFVASNDAEVEQSNGDGTNAPREMDDEELDAEDVGRDDFDDMYMTIDEADDLIPPVVDDTKDDGIPKKACILPLYSLLSAEEQAKVFAPIDEGHRLIVVATNVAETSITIPGISYVVDTGRQKCRNYNSGTGIASYDVMWISKASANQRAGRAGRTGPGHCYRLYSSSLFSRHMDAFALPEVLTRPLEDVIMAMKALKISNVSQFPFPTPPDWSQIDAAVKLLANIGCVDISNVERDGGDGVATRLGHAVAKLPLGVRYGKMLLVAAQAGVLDYAIVLVAVLSEANPFSDNSIPSVGQDNDLEDDNEEDDELDDVDKKLVEDREKSKRQSKKWNHSGGDVLAALLAVGAYTFAGRAAGEQSEKLANRRFCDENGLNYTIMARIQKMRMHLASISKNRLRTAPGVAAKTGGFSYKMAPPNKLQERLLIQTIASGLLDHVAVLAPAGSISADYPIDLRSAYMSCTSSTKEPLFLDRASTLYTRDYRQLPRWVCYNSILRKTAKDGTPIAVMKNITPIDSAWLGKLAKGTRLLAFGAPLLSPLPIYDMDEDAILCSVTTKFGCHGWEIPPAKQDLYKTLQSLNGKQAAGFLADDSFRWFARFLLEGKVFPELEGLELNDNPTLITRRSPSAKVHLLVGALSGAGIDSGRALCKYWAEVDDKFLFKQLKAWIKHEKQLEAKKLWIKVVRNNIKQWKAAN